MCVKPTTSAIKANGGALNNETNITNKYSWLRSFLRPNSLYEFKKICRSNAPALKANVARFNPINRLLPDGAYGKRRNRLEVTPFIEQLTKKIGSEAWHGPYRTFHEILRFMFKTYGVFSNRKHLLNIAWKLRVQDKDIINVERAISDEALDDDAYRLYVNNPHFPWNLTAHEVLRYKIGSFCGHAATVFMVFAKALGFSNVRLVSSISNFDYNREYCKKGRFTTPDPERKVLALSGHQLVLAQLENGRWALINTSLYPIEIITTTSDGKPIYPETLIEKDILIESMLEGENPEVALQRVVAVGVDGNDDLHMVNGRFAKNIGMSGDYRIGSHHCLRHPLPELGLRSKKRR